MEAEGTMIRPPLSSTSSSTSDSSAALTAARISSVDCAVSKAISRATFWTPMRISTSYLLSHTSSGARLAPVVTLTSSGAHGFLGLVGAGPHGREGPETAADERRCDADRGVLRQRRLVGQPVPRRGLRHADEGDADEHGLLLLHRGLARDDLGHRLGTGEVDLVEPLAHLGLVGQ